MKVFRLIIFSLVLGGTISLFGASSDATPKLTPQQRIELIRSHLRTYIEIEKGIKEGELEKSDLDPALSELKKLGVVNKNGRLNKRLMKQVLDPTKYPEQNMPILELPPAEQAKLVDAINGKEPPTRGLSRLGEAWDHAYLKNFAKLTVKHAFRMELTPKEKMMYALVGGATNVISGLYGLLEEDASAPEGEHSTAMTVMTLGLVDYVPTTKDVTRMASNAVKKAGLKTYDALANWRINKTMAKMEKENEEYKAANNGQPLYTDDQLDEVREWAEWGWDLPKRLMLREKLTRGEWIAVKVIQGIDKVRRFLSNLGRRETVHADTEIASAMREFLADTTRDAVSGMVEALQGAAKGQWENVKEGVKYTVEKAKNGKDFVVKATIDGKDYILHKVAGAKNYVLEAGGEVLSYLADTETVKQAKNVAEGAQQLAQSLADGFALIAPETAKSAQDIIESVKGGLASVTGQLRDLVGRALGREDEPPTENEKLKEYVEKELPELLGKLAKAETVEDVTSTIEEIKNKLLESTHAAATEAILEGKINDEVLSQVFDLRELIENKMLLGVKELIPTLPEDVRKQLEGDKKLQSAIKKAEEEMKTRDAYEHVHSAISDLTGKDDPATTKTINDTIEGLKKFAENIEDDNPNGPDEAAKKAALEKMAQDVPGQDFSAFELALAGVLDDNTFKGQEEAKFAEVYSALTKTVAVAEKLGVQAEEFKAIQQRATMELVRKIQKETDDPKEAAAKLKAFENAFTDDAARESFKEAAQNASNAQQILDRLNNLAQNNSDPLGGDVLVNTLLSAAETNKRILENAGQEVEEAAAKILLEQITTITAAKARNGSITAKQSFDAIDRVRKMFGQEVLTDVAEQEMVKRTFTKHFDAMTTEINEQVEESGKWSFTRWVRRVKDRGILSATNKAAAQTVKELELTNGKADFNDVKTQLAEYQADENPFMKTADFMEALFKSDIANKEELLKDCVKYLMEKAAGNPKRPNYREMKAQIQELINQVTHYNINADLVNLINGEYHTQLHTMMTQEAATSTANNTLFGNQKNNNDDDGDDEFHDAAEDEIEQALNDNNIEELIKLYNKAKDAGNTADMNRISKGIENIKTGDGAATAEQLAELKKQIAEEGRGTGVETHKSAPTQDNSSKDGSGGSTVETHNGSATDNNGLTAGQRAHERDVNDPNNDEGYGNDGNDSNDGDESDEEGEWHDAETGE